MITEKQMEHGHLWRGQRMKGWYLSEKFDGIRAYWDGLQMWTRSGNEITLPRTIRDSLPPLALDGEIWAGYGQLDAARNAVLHGHWTAAHRFLVFDCPLVQADWPARLAVAGKLIGNASRVEVVQYAVAESQKHPFRLMREVHERGGEGVICRAPGRLYEPGRSENIVKLKRAFYEIFA